MIHRDKRAAASALLRAASQRRTVEGRCAWCHQVFDDKATVLKGRTACGRCGVATTTPWPSSEDLTEAYGTWYRPESGRFSGAGDRLFRLLRGGYSRRLDAIAPPGPILDIGSGEGVLVDALRRRGRAASGVDPYSNQSDIPLSDLDEMEGRWAAVVFWHSLEHMPDPTAGLKMACDLLQDGGVLVVAVPNTASVQARVFGDDWLHLDLPRHLVHIPASRLEEEVEKNGLRVERVSHYRGGAIVFGWLHGMVRWFSPGMHLYDAIRKPEARSQPMTSSRRLVTIFLGCLVLPLAMAAAATEVAFRKGGTVCLEARSL